MELLALALSFGITPKKFPLLKYVTAMEFLSQKLEECGDANSIEKARAIQNEVFTHLKQGDKMTLKSNLMQTQRKILQELKEDASIIKCPADKGKKW